MFLTLRYLYQQIHESFQSIGGGPGNGGMPDMASMMQMMQGMGMGGGEDGVGAAAVRRGAVPAGRGGGGERRTPAARAGGSVPLRTQPFVRDGLPAHRRGGASDAALAAGAARCTVPGAARVAATA